MKRLVSFALTSGEGYAKSNPQESVFAEWLHTDNPFDWREDLRLYAKEKGWDLKEFDCESVASALAFMIDHSPAFSNCVLRTDVQLPGGAVLLDSKAGGEQAPIMLLWEEDAVSEHYT